MGTSLPTVASRSSKSGPETVDGGMETLLVPLLGEGVDCWRPVAARRYGPDGVYRIVPDEMIPAGEEWAFAPGDIVEAEHRRQDGETRLFARRLAPGKDVR